MSPLRFAVPDEFANSGLYERFGAIIRERSTGKIVGHIQELGSWDTVEQLRLPGGNPLSLAIKVGKSIAKLHKIQKTLNTIQSLATVGALASVASLGVSIAGFAAVMTRLDRMDGKLDALLARSEAIQGLVLRLNVKADALALSRLRAALGELELAHETRDLDRRQGMITAAVGKLAELRQYYALLLGSAEFCAVQSDDLGALADAQERFVAACLGELTGEFLLDDLGVMQKRRQQQRALFDQIGWHDEKELHELVLRADRHAKVNLVTDPEVRVERVKAVVGIRAESIARLDSICELAGYLHEAGVSPTEYLKQVERQSAESDEPLLVLDRREG